MEYGVRSIVISKSGFVAGILILAALSSLSKSQDSTLGTQVSIVTHGNNTMVWSSLLDTSVYTLQYDALFPDSQLPSTCGDRMLRCKAHIFHETHGSRAALVASLSNGVALTVYDKINSDNFTFVDQLLVTPQEENINCSFTSFTTTSDDRLLVSCLKFTPEVEYEVDMWLFEVHVSFAAVNESYLELLNVRDAPYQSYSTGLSSIFFYDGELSHEPYIVWFDDEVLFVASLQSPHFTPQEFFADTTDFVCRGNRVRDVRQSSDWRRLLVYCSENTAIEVDIRSRGGPNVQYVRSKTRFYCEDQGELPYLEERNETLVFVSQGNTDVIISHPLNLSEEYTADCAVSEYTIWFIGSSRDGIIALTSVLENDTTILALDATVNHQLFDGRILVYSDSNSSAVINLACPAVRFTVNQTFVLTVFEFNHNFSCPMELPSTESTVAPNATTVFTEDTQPTTMAMGGSEASQLQLIIGLAVGIPLPLLVISVIALIVYYVRCRGRGRNDRPIQLTGGDNINGGSSSEDVEDGGDVAETEFGAAEAFDGEQGSTEAGMTESGEERGAARVHIPPGPASTFPSDLRPPETASHPEKNNSPVRHCPPNNCQDERLTDINLHPVTTQPTVASSM